VEAKRGREARRQSKIYHCTIDRAYSDNWKLVRCLYKDIGNGDIDRPHCYHHISERAASALTTVVLSVVSTSIVRAKHGLP